MGETVLETLGRLPHFRQVAPDTLARIADASRVRTYGRGELVVREGEACRAFFALRSGAARIFRITRDGREQMIRALRPGDAFAEAALLNMPAYPVNVEATEDGTEVVEIGGETFLALFDGDPRVPRAIVAALAARLHFLVERVEQLTVLSAGARLARYLLDLPSAGPPDEPTVALPTTKRELAGYLGLAPETLSRVLRRWQDRGLVRSDPGRVTLLDVGTLLAVASDAKQAPGGTC